MATGSWLRARPAPVVFATLDQHAAYDTTTPCQKWLTRPRQEPRWGRLRPSCLSALKAWAMSLVVTTKTVERQSADIAKVAWDCTTLDHRSPQLVAAIAERSGSLADRKQLPPYGAQTVATLAWVCAELGHHTPGRVHRH
jgi:hypothetical protein